MADRSGDQYKKWSEHRLLAGILTILQDWFQQVITEAIVSVSEMQGLIDDTTLRTLRVDPSTNSLQTISYEHHEIHGGSHYFVRGVQDLTINQVLGFTFQTPNTAKWIHWTWEIDTESEAAWAIYEGVAVITPLANAVTPYNNNRNSANTSGAILKYEKHANLAAANAKTNVGGATLLSSGISGAGKDAGRASRQNELILKQNTIYCLRGTASAAGYINFDMNWYEHTDKD